MMTRVQLYCSPTTSEVAAEYPTLHEAIDWTSPPGAEVSLVCNGVLLAKAVARKWTLEQAGIERLVNEFAKLRIRVLAFEADEERRLEDDERKANRGAKAPQ